jgi:choline kinase
MKAIILAAGVGKRLGKETGDRPKSLLKFDGVSLLERHFQLLQKFGIESVILVIGYQSPMIQEEITRLNLHHWVKTIENPNYTQGSVISLWCAKEFLATGEEVLLMDADVLYDAQILERLVNTKKTNCFLLDRNFEDGVEPVKLCVKDNLLVEFRKEINPQLQFDFQGESVGFFKFSGEVAQRLAQRTDFYKQNALENEPYEDAIRDLLLETPPAFNYEDITGYSWIEIDFPEDILKAKQLSVNSYQ